MTGDSVDYLHRFARLPASDGEYNVDLNGERPGGLKQTFTTTPGASYRVTFDLTYNDGCDRDAGVLFVRNDDGIRATYFAFLGPTTPETFDFVADGDGSTTLSFSSSEEFNIACGPVLDNVRVALAGPAKLDARATSKATKPVYSSDVLTQGRQYRVTIRGTSSSWAPSIMAPDGQRARNWVVCGTPESAPQIASPGNANGRVGEDPAFLFALPQTGTKCNPKFRTLLPYKQSGLRFDLSGGDSFDTTLVPDGDPSTPSADHSYTYTVFGQGSPLKIRFADNSPADNSGRYEISVVDANTTDA